MLDEVAASAPTASALGISQFTYISTVLIIELCLWKLCAGYGSPV
jgi:hypothetical protein